MFNLEIQFCCFFYFEKQRSQIIDNRQKNYQINPTKLIQTILKCYQITNNMHNLKYTMDTQD